MAVLRVLTKQEMDMVRELGLANEAVVVTTREALDAADITVKDAEDVVEDYYLGGEPDTIIDFALHREHYFFESIREQKKKESE